MYIYIYSPICFFIALRSRPFQVVCMPPPAKSYKAANGSKRAGALQFTYLGVPTQPCKIAIIIATESCHDDGQIASGWHRGKDHECWKVRRWLAWYHQESPYDPLWQLALHVPCGFPWSIETTRADRPSPVLSSIHFCLCQLTQL